MERLEPLWSAFEKIAVIFSFVVCFVLVMVLFLLAIGVLTIAPALPGLRSDLACPLIADITGVVNDLGNAVITRTIPISQTIPVVFDLPLNQTTNVVLTEPVTLNRPTSFTLPAGGGYINGQVSMTLPRGQQLPVKLAMTVPVRQNLPVQMSVDVRIPLSETDLGPVVDDLKRLLFPWLDKLNDLLRCPAP